MILQLTALPNQIMQPPNVDYIRILPELVLSAFGMLIMVLDPVIDQRRAAKTLGFVALLGALASVAATFLQAGSPGEAFSHMVRVDNFSIFFHIVILAIVVLTILTSFEYMETQRIRAGEYYGLILMGAAGMCLMTSAVELVLIFIALEISSISTYILAGFLRSDPRSSEASLKYFLLGSFATAFFLYGVALMFGATGSTSIAEISTALRTGYVPTLAFVAVAMIFVGLGFKVGAAPFHVWTPDVYEGAPSPVVGLMSTAPKAATFAVLLRIIFEARVPGTFWLVWVAAVLSMTLGNLGALRQSNIKRMLAYSSIAHAGYLLVAFASAPASGVPSAMFYTASYAAMNVGAFAIISHIGNYGERYVSIDDYAGLGRRHPFLAAVLTVFLLSLIGIPATGGFFAKFYVFSAALHANLVGLTILGVINSAIASYYYLRVIVVMYMNEPQGEVVPLTPLPAGVSMVLVLSLLATLYLGIVPGAVLTYAQDSVRNLTHEVGYQLSAISHQR
jgi:NADH-quinone oxidoreductase subunit N